MVSMHEESSPSPQLLPTPQCVGREFVRQYYTLLAEAPRYVHRFYSNESIFVHGSDTEEIVGQTAIQNKIKDLSFEECRTRIRALDAHETLGKGVVVQVVGEISVNSGPMRRFVQTFVLAPQSEKKYYVHNDIFRYEDELFLDKLPQENGAPADPEAETTTCVDDGHRRVGSIHNQVAMNNGNTHHPDEIENVRYNATHSPAQPQQMPVLSQQQNLNQQMPTQAPCPVFTAGLTSSTQQQVADGPVPYSDVDFGTIHVSSASAPAPASVQQAPPTVIPYGQQPLPQRSQPQQAGQAQATPTTVAATGPAAPLPSTQPEPISTTGTVTTEQPQRPPSVEKTSPAPSEEREETVETASADKTWANIAKQKSNRSPHQAPPPQQQPQHAPPAAGTSAPAVLSPTGPQAPHAGHFQADSANKSAQPPQGGRHSHPHRAPRPANAYAGGFIQDTRSSPVPSGHQPNVAGGGSRVGPAPGGHADLYPNEQQVYVKNLPMDTAEDALKEYFESQGYTGIVETRVRRKNTNGPHTCFAFMTFDSAETAQKLIQKKMFSFRGVDIVVDEKRVMEKGGGGGGGNYPYNGPRGFPGPAMSGGGRGNMSHMRGGAVQRGGAPNRSAVPGGFVGQGGNRQPGGRTVYSSSAGRGGGGMPHPQ